MGKGADQVKAKIVQLKKRKEELLKALPKGSRDIGEAAQKAFAARQIYEDKMSAIRKVEHNMELLDLDVKVGALGKRF